MTIIEILKKVAKDADKIWREADKCDIPPDSSETIKKLAYCIEYDTETVIQKLIREEEK
jgi:hypothetical protein